MGDDTFFTLFAETMSIITVAHFMFILVAAEIQFLHHNLQEK